MNAFKVLLAAMLVSCAATLSAGERQLPPFNPELKPASDEGEQAMKTFQLKRGLKVSLWAAEPQLANPVALYIDNQGRVYVCETFRDACSTGGIGATWEQDISLRTADGRLDFMNKRWGAEITRYDNARERIRLLQDTNGDGKADKDTVFATFGETLDGVIAGVLPYKGDVFVTNIPHLWRLRDANNDGIADDYTSLHYGFGVHGGYYGHDLHGLRMGPDGKLYFSSGDRGFVLKAGKEILNYPDEGGVIRCNPDGSELEVFAHGLRNPQELAFDEFGNLFTCDNNSDGGDKARWVYIPEGSDAGWRIGYQFMNAPLTRGPWNLEKIWHPHHKGQPAYIVPPITNFISGPSGLTYYPGTGLNKQFEKRFVLVEFRGGASNSGVHTFALKPKGASFEMVDAEQTIWNVLGTDADFGPDGALYLTDWTHGWGRPMKGRIFKFTTDEMQHNPLVQQTQALLAEGLKNKKPDELAELLEHPDMRVRQDAQFELVDLGKKGFEKLKKVAQKSKHQLARVHAVWAIGQLGRHKSEYCKELLPLLNDPDAEIRAQAAKMAGDCLYKPALPKVVALLEDSSARVRLLAAISLARIGDESVIPPLLAMLRANKDEDPTLRHGGVQGLAGVSTPASLAPHMNDASPAVRMAVLLTLRRLKSPQIAHFLNDREPDLVVEAARAINDIPIETAMPQLASLAGATNKETAAPQFKAEYWHNLNGNFDALRKLIADGKTPDEVLHLALPAIPADKADNYGCRLSGLLTAPKDGEYTFWIVGDDGAELYLSSDASPANKKQIAFTKGYTGPAEWEKSPEQKSAKIALNAGQKYYVEALMYEGGGNDNLSVGWTLPDGTLQRPIGEASDARPLMLRVLNANFRLGQPANAVVLAAFAARKDALASLRVEALQQLGDWAAPSPRDRVMNLQRPLPERDAKVAIDALKPHLAGILKDAPGDVLANACALTGKYKLTEHAAQLHELTRNTKAEVDARIAALKALGEMRDGQLAELVRAALADKQIKLRQEAFVQLGTLDQSLALPILKETLETASYPEKQTAIEVLSKMRTVPADAILAEWLEKLAANKVDDEIRLDLIEAAKRCGDAKVKASLKKYEDSVAAVAKEDELAAFKICMKGGDAELGKKIFYENNKAQCLRCHKLHGNGGEVGPELKGIAAKYDRAYFLEALVAPNAKIAEGFELQIVTLNDGKVVTGNLKKEDDKHLALIAADGKIAEIPKSEIKSRKSQKASAMPPMHDILSKSELRDVIEFLTTQK